jgi:hypothetical protein
MARRALIDSQTPQARKAAEELTSGSAAPQRRRPAKGPKKEYRIGSLTKPYERDDGVKTVKISITLNIEVLGKLEQYLLGAKFAGVGRTEWIESALEHAVDRRYMPPRRRRSGAEEQDSEAAEPQSSSAAADEEGEA